MLLENRELTYHFNGTSYKTKHGGAFDRGMADSFYRRPRRPHMYPNGTLLGEEVRLKVDTPEYDAYMAGYDYNEELGDHKDWG